MTTVTLVYAEPDYKLAMRLRGDLEAEHIPVSESLTAGAVVVAVLSGGGMQSAKVMDTLEKATDAYHHILPVLSENIKLPRLIDHLPPLNFSQSYSASALIERVRQLSAPDAPRPLTALTASKRRQNRQSALIWGIAAIGIFFVGIIGVGVFGLQAPAERFYGIETQVYLTQRVFIDQALPRGTEDALNFEATIPHIPTKARQEAIATATWIVSGQDGTFVPRSTEQALSFETTLVHISTHVQERLVATVTQFAVTNAAITPTPTTEASPESTP